MTEWRGYVVRALEDLTITMKDIKKSVKDLDAHVNDEVSKMHDRMDKMEKNFNNMKRRDAVESKEWNIYKKILCFIGGGVCLAVINLLFNYIASLL